MTPRFVRILVAQAIFSLGWSLYLLLPKYLAVELHADAETVGSLSAMGGLLSLALIPVAARGIDQLGRKLFFAAGCALLCALSLGFMVVREVGPLMYLLSALTGASFLLAYNAGATLATDEIPPAKLAQAIGIFGASNMGMNAVSTVVGEKLAAAWGWNAVFTLGAVTSVAAAAISLGTAEPSRRKGAATRDLPGPAAARVWPPLASSALLGIAFAAMFVFSQPYALALGAREVSEFFVGFTLAALTMRAFFGHLGDRFGRVRVSIAGIAVYAAAVASMMLLRPALLILHGAAFGLAHGVVYPTLNAVVMERMGLSRRGRAMSLYTGAFNVGSTVAGFGWGTLAQRSGYPAVYAASALLCVVAALCLVEVRSPSPG